MNKDKKAVIIVIDSMGIGALPDAPDYGDELTADTVGNIAKTVGLNIPNLEKLGFGNIKDLEGVKKVKKPKASYGIAKMKSKGKDTTTGHWEIAGLVLDEPFKTYINFPDELINEFIEKTGCKGILGNIPASGTKIIEDLNEEHQKTKYPIIYTSADSVFQIAVDIDVIPVETLYEWCKIAREILNNGYGVSRVIARPYQIIDGKPTRVGALRHDYSLEPPKDTLLDEIEKAGGEVFGVGKIKDIFVGKGVTRYQTTGSNMEGLKLTLKTIKNDDANLIFTNLVDTDMLFGHRRDTLGYKNAIEEIDTFLPKIIKAISDDTILIITADHGCDPTHKGTDHTREMVPFLIYGKNYPAEACGTKESFTYLADVVRTWLELDTEKKENKTESIEEIQAKEPPATKRIDDINDELWLPKF